VSTFRRQMMVTLDGEPFKVTTMSKDHLRAEEAIGREKLDVQTSPLHLQTRVAFFSFQRCYPEHPLARNWNGFCEVFDDIDDLEEEEASAGIMDPTQPEALES
jgi:hypothetical protein